ncbi:unnamed protein product [Linum tenue]|uniref:Proteasome subunit beta n=1 Tax=Linum tenue TaxID=586396 RepID=A0AAV0NEV3_9ROSI|nr:unnamed protein product [Linum tenue]
MSSSSIVEAPPKGGFSFDLCKRNEMLSGKGVKHPNYRKTGTTIVGLIFQDGVILGADTRATSGPIVCDKNCEKIHFMAPNIYCCGAGTAADTESVTDMVSSQLQLHRYHTGRESRVITALTLLKKHLFNYQGHISAALVLGGVDCTGPHLHTIYPHGSTDTLPFATMGSGSLAAMAVFESKYKEGLNKKEGIKLVTEAICSGIFNDLGSGSNVDVCVITKVGKLLPDIFQFLGRSFSLYQFNFVLNGCGTGGKRIHEKPLKTQSTHIRQCEGIHLPQEDRLVSLSLLQQISI